MGKVAVGVKSEVWEGMREGSWDGVGQSHGVGRWWCICWNLVVNECGAVSDEKWGFGCGMKMGLGSLARVND